MVNYAGFYINVQEFEGLRVSGPSGFGHLGLRRVYNSGLRVEGFRRVTSDLKSKRSGFRLNPGSTNALACSSRKGRVFIMAGPF